MPSPDPGGSGAAEPVSRLECGGCGTRAPAGEAYPFRCPGAGGEDDTDHVLDRILDAARADPGGRSFLDPAAKPFLRYRKLFHSYHAALEGGLSDADYQAIVRDLDAAVAEVEGRGFHSTPFDPSESLGRRLGFAAPDAMWIKDETGNVAGSHKARHLMGIMIWLRVMDCLGRGRAHAPLAIASCGNAALAAAVVARAAGRRLRVFLPAGANKAVVDRLTRLGAQLSFCTRNPAGRGDPCYHGFKEAVKGGALPFTCQGSENGLTIEGGETLSHEMISVLAREGKSLDRIFIQVGGGVLASSCIRAFQTAADLGLVRSLPRVHAVQTEGGHPLSCAYDRVVTRILQAHGAPPPTSAEARARFIQTHVPPDLVEEALCHAATHRSHYMQPWETEPRSIADGILDDETYDWLAVVRGMTATGGHPVVVSEETLKEASALARSTTSIPVCPTGSAGLAGCLELCRAGVVRPDETVGLLFTGIQR